MKRKVKKEPPKPLLIAVILDESGSMESKQSDVIGGFNTFLADQQNGPGDCRLSLTKFNTSCTVMLRPTPIQHVKPLTKATYTPGGNTALLDAVANTITTVETDKQEKERVLVVIITDGEENSSRETTLDQVKARVAGCERRGDWTFTYLGVDPAKWADRGVTRSAANNAVYDPARPRESFAGLSVNTTRFRASGMSMTQCFYAPSDQQQPDPDPAA